VAEREPCPSLQVEERHGAVVKFFPDGVDDLERSLRFYRDGLGLKTEGIVLLWSIRMLITVKRSPSKSSQDSAAVVCFAAQGRFIPAFLRVTQIRRMLPR